MNYEQIYENLIAKYGTWEKPKGVYTERHRKHPGCMGGRYVKGNAFYVSARVHFVCHILLVKMYPRSEKLIEAVGLMRTRVTSRGYEWLKTRWAKIISNRMTKMYVDNPEIRLHLSINTSARRSETKAKMSIAKLGKKQSYELVEKRAAANRGKKRSEQAIANMKAAQNRPGVKAKVIRTGFKHSEETKQKIREKAILQHLRLKEISK